MLTRELIQTLCGQLGHPDGAGPCIKKLVAENWLEQVADLRHVPRTRLEKWGLPLKLVHEIYEYLTDADAKQSLNQINAFVNYKLRPALGAISPGHYLTEMRDDAEKRRHPKVWAAKVLQRSFRRRQAQKARAQYATDDLVHDFVEAAEFRRPAEKDSDALRLKRAEDKLRHFIRMWRRRKANTASGKGAAAASGWDSCMSVIQPTCVLSQTLSKEPNGIPMHLFKMSKGVVRDCETTQLLKRYGADLQRSERELTPYIHQLVTLNWLEDTSDLDLVEDRHWEEWGIPEKLVVLIKTEAQEKAEQGISESYSQANNRISDFFWSLFS